jgi:mRNA deadenylase 3'-5' endonuclease subunit Ccr4
LLLLPDAGAARIDQSQRIKVKGYPHDEFPASMQPVFASAAFKVLVHRFQVRRVVSHASASRV